MRRKSWKMMPIVRRRWGICHSRMLRREKPLTITRPSEGSISPIKILITVDFPLPEGPTMNTNSPSLISKERPLRAWVPFGYSFTTSINRIMSLFTFPAVGRPSCYFQTA